MKMTLKTELQDYLGDVSKFEYVLYRDIVYQVCGDPDKYNVVPVLDVKKRHITSISGSDLVTPLDVEFTFIPKTGDEIL